jgi:hypothetical protein
MNRTQRSPLTWATLGLLAALVATNGVLLILLRTGGPLVGLTFYAVLFAVAYRGRQRASPAVMVGGLVGLVVHIVEVSVAGWPACPFLMGFNLALPAALAVVVWLAGRLARPVQGDK